MQANTCTELSTAMHLQPYPSEQVQLPFSEEWGQLQRALEQQQSQQSQESQQQPMDTNNGVLDRLQKPEIDSFSGLPKHNPDYTTLSSPQSLPNDITMSQLASSLAAALGMTQQQQTISEAQPFQSLALQEPQTQLSGTIPENDPQAMSTEEALSKLLVEIFANQQQQQQQQQPQQTPSVSDTSCETVGSNPISVTESEASFEIPLGMPSLLVDSPTTGDNGHVDSLPTPPTAARHVWPLPIDSQSPTTTSESVDLVQETGLGNGINANQDDTFMLPTDQQIDNEDVPLSNRAEGFFELADILLAARAATAGIITPPLSASTLQPLTQMDALTPPNSNSSQPMPGTETTSTDEYADQQVVKNVSSPLKLSTMPFQPTQNTDSAQPLSPCNLPTDSMSLRPIVMTAAATTTLPAVTHSSNSNSDNNNNNNNSNGNSRSSNLSSAHQSSLRLGSLNAVGKVRTIHSMPSTKTVSPTHTRLLHDNSRQRSNSASAVTQRRSPLASSNGIKPSLGHSTHGMTASHHPLSDSMARNRSNTIPGELKFSQEKVNKRGSAFNPNLHGITTARAVAANRGIHVKVPQNDHSFVISPSPQQIHFSAPISPGSPPDSHQSGRVPSLHTTSPSSGTRSLGAGPTASPALSFIDMSPRSTTKPNLPTPNTDPTRNFSMHAVPIGMFSRSSTVPMQTNNNKANSKANNFTSTISFSTPDSTGAHHRRLPESEPPKVYIAPYPSGPVTRLPLPPLNTSNDASGRVDNISVSGTGSLRRTHPTIDLATVDLDDVTVATLKRLLRKRGQDTRGKKAELVARVRAEIEMIDRSSSKTTKPPPPPPVVPTLTALRSGKGSFPPLPLSPTQSIDIYKGHQTNEGIASLVSVGSVNPPMVDFAPTGLSHSTVVHPSGNSVAAMTAATLPPTPLVSSSSHWNDGSATVYPTNTDSSDQMVVEPLSPIPSDSWTAKDLDEWLHMREQ